MSFRRRHIYRLGGGSDAVAGRLRFVQRRIMNDAGWFVSRGISSFGEIGHVLRGRESQTERRFERYAACGRSVVRILGMLGDPSWVARDLAFSPRDTGYWEATARVVDLANSLGMYVKFALFADAQIVMPNHSEREAAVRAFAEFCAARPGILPSLSNEPYKNGWSSAVDPALLSLADLFSRLVGHRDFSIGDAGDSALLADRFEEQSHHCNCLDVHPDRVQPANDKRYRRWIDHLEGFSELPSVSNRDAIIDEEEPIGVHPRFDPGRRESDPDAMVAGMVAALCVCYPFTYHWIPEEAGQFDVESLPGLTPEVGAMLAQIPQDPSWVYKNDGWPGSPTSGIVWSGAEGKVRHLVQGRKAFSVAYGEADFDHAVRWNAGWSPRVIWSGARVRVWAVNQ